MCSLLNRAEIRREVLAVLRERTAYPEAIVQLAEHIARQHAAKRDATTQRRKELVQTRRAWLQVLGTATGSKLTRQRAASAAIRDRVDAAAFHKASSTVSTANFFLRTAEPRLWCLLHVLRATGPEAIALHAYCAAVLSDEGARAYALGAERAWLSWLPVKEAIEVLAWRVAYPRG